MRGIKRSVTLRCVFLLLYICEVLACLVFLFLPTYKDHVLLKLMLAITNNIILLVFVIKKRDK